MYYNKCRGSTIWEYKGQCSQSMEYGGGSVCEHYLDIVCEHYLDIVLPYRTRTITLKETSPNAIHARGSHESGEGSLIVLGQGT